jgi:hypothetical protein
MTDYSNNIDLREKLAHIDQMLADHDHRRADMDRIRAEIDRAFAERDRRRQEMRYQPALAVISGLTAGAALFAAGAAFAKLFFGI